MREKLNQLLGKLISAHTTGDRLLIASEIREQVEPALLAHDLAINDGIEPAAAELNGFNADDHDAVMETLAQKQDELIASLSVDLRAPEDEKSEPPVTGQSVPDATGDSQTTAVPNEADLPPGVPQVA
jgi:hypothetical protein